jgi:hypothetical protein
MKDLVISGEEITFQDQPKTQKAEILLKTMKGSWPFDFDLGIDYRKILKKPFSEVETKEELQRNLKKIGAKNIKISVTLNGRNATIAMTFELDNQEQSATLNLAGETPALIFGV